MKHFDVVELLKNQGFMTKNFVGQRFVIIERPSSEGFYLSATHENGISFPVKPEDVRVIGNINDLVDRLDGEK